MKLAAIYAFANKGFAARPGNCGISFQAGGVAIAHITPSQSGLPTLEYCEFIPDVTPSQLSTLVPKLNLQGVQCTWILQPRDYQLLLLDPLPVQAEELASALRWKVKEFIDFPIDEAVIDYFPIFSEANSARQKLYVVVAKASYLQTTAELIKKSGLKLTAINIPELSLRNIAALFAADQQGVALISFSTYQSLLIITHKADLYLARSIDLSLSKFLQIPPSEQAAKQGLLDAVVLEIQRSFDYYQNQMRQPHVNKLLVNLQNPVITTYLASELGCNTEVLDLQKILNCGDKPSDMQNSLLLTAIGGALDAGNVYAEKH